MPERNNLIEERFTLAHTSRGCSTWSAGSITFRPVAETSWRKDKVWRKAVYLIAARKQTGVTGRGQD
jgi:hypothetical protein